MQKENEFLEVLLHMYMQKQNRTVYGKIALIDKYDQSY